MALRQSCNSSPPSRLEMDSPNGEDSQWGHCHLSPPCCPSESTACRRYISTPCLCPAPCFASDLLSGGLQGSLESARVEAVKVSDLSTQSPHQLFLQDLEIELDQGPPLQRRIQLCFSPVQPR